MKPRAWYFIGVLLPLLLLLIVLPVVARSQTAPAATYDLSWNVIGGGGASFNTAGHYTLGGTIGQNAVGSVSSGGYNLNVGFWQPGRYEVYLPVVLR